jgi:hypothetical protein
LVHRRAHVRPAFIRRHSRVRPIIARPERVHRAAASRQESIRRHNTVRQAAAIPGIVRRQMAAGRVAAGQAA